MSVLSKPTLFKQFFPALSWYYEPIVQQYCQPQLQAYQTQNQTGLQFRICDYVVECILEHVNEVNKAEQGVTGILLGIAPTILTQLGSSTTEMSLLALRRPVLSMCLAMGGPVVAPTRLFECEDPRDIIGKPDQGEWTPLKRRYTGTLIKPRSCIAAAAVSATQYLLALGAIANVAVMGYQLGYMSVSVAVGCDQQFHFLLWNFMASCIYFIGFLAFRTRGRIIARSSRRSASAQAVVDISSRKGRALYTVSRRLQIELSPCVYQIIATKEEISLEWKPETLTFILLSSFVSILIVGQIIYGTVLLSSVLLVSPSDAIPIVCRYVLSVVVCRGVLMFELAGIRQTIGQATLIADKPTIAEQQGEQIKRGEIGRAETI